MTGFLQLELFFLYWAAVYTLSTGIECKANDESLVLISNEDDFTFTPACAHNAGKLEIFTVEYRGDNFFVDVNFFYQCFDHSNKLIKEKNITKDIFSMEAVRILLDSADYYYGITCSVWACFEDSEGEFKRLPQNNCSAFYVKDECASPSDNNCHHNASCSNLENDTFVCFCDAGYTGNGTHCEDIDECLTQPCNISADCVNSPPGSFSCSCRPGFTGDGISCHNINECSEDMSNCSHMENCRDTVGGYECDCIEGYQKNGFMCEDVDECAGGGIGVLTCNSNAICHNTMGSFSCSCRPGFSGNGTSCDNIDECSTGVYNCHVNASCVDTPGSFNCSCNPEHKGNGTSCENIDECEEDVHNCTDLENCMDILGGYECNCYKGCTRKGDFCDVDTETSLHLAGLCSIFVVVVVIVAVVFLVIYVPKKYIGKKKSRWSFIHHGGLLNKTSSKSEIDVVVLQNLFEKRKEVVENDDISIVHELTSGKAKRDAENQLNPAVENPEDSICQISPDHVMDTRSEVEETETAEMQTEINSQENSVPGCIMDNRDGSEADDKPLNCPLDLYGEINSLDCSPEGSENFINSDSIVRLELDEQRPYIPAKFSASTSGTDYITM